MISAEVLAAWAGGIGVVGVLWAAWVSVREGEPRAAVRLVGLGLLLSLLFFVPVLLPGPVATWLSWILLGGAGVLALLFLIPLRGRNDLSWGEPMPGVDERDIMFSRAALSPGTERFAEHYRRRPEHRDPDASFRKEPGLLDAGAIHHHPLGFPAADAAFWTIERLRPWVEGHASETESEGSGGRGPGEQSGDVGGVKLGGEASVDASASNLPATASELTRFLKGWLTKIGAHSVGVTTLRDYHLYSHVGRGAEYGEPVELDHPFALALTVEMDREMVDPAPRSPTVMESALQYLRAGVMAVQVADLIRRLGYRARAHVDGNYRVICPLVARDAGLGELGRMGLLMTPRLGPRVRIAVVTTDLPLVADSACSDSTVIDFCLRCRKCAEVCPSQAISLDPPRDDEHGVRRWKIDAEACFTLWTRMGTDCARCMAVCPYSHPDNLLHGAVRWGIRNNGLFRGAAVWMDDLIYGRRPPPKELPGWMALSESRRAGERMKR